MLWDLVCLIGAGNADNDIKMVPKIWCCNALNSTRWVMLVLSCLAVELSRWQPFREVQTLLCQDKGQSNTGNRQERSLQDHPASPLPSLLGDQTHAATLTHPANLPGEMAQAPACSQEISSISLSSWLESFPSCLKLLYRRLSSLLLDLLAVDREIRLLLSCLPPPLM